MMGDAGRSFKAAESKSQKKQTTGTELKAPKSSGCSRAEGLMRNPCTWLRESQLRGWEGDQGSISLASGLEVTFWPRSCRKKKIPEECCKPGPVSHVDGVSWNEG